MPKKAVSSAALRTSLITREALRKRRPLGAAL